MGVRASFCAVAAGVGVLAGAAPAYGGTASVFFGTAGHHTFRTPAGVTSFSVTLAGERGATAAPGDHRFTVVATDMLGNTSTRTVTYTVRAAQPSPQLAISGATVKRCARPRRCARVTVTGTAPDGRVTLLAVRGGSVRRVRAMAANGQFKLPRGARHAGWDLTVTQGSAAAERRVTVPSRPRRS